MFGQKWVPVVFTVVVSAAVVYGLLGSPAPEGELPRPDVIRDVVYDHATAVDAVRGNPQDEVNPRTPGAVVLLLPLLLADSDYLTWTAAVVSVIAAGFITGVVTRLTGKNVRLVAAVVLPLSVAFGQTISQGNVFIVLAACLSWAWVHTEEGSELPAGVLVGLAAASRLWPLLLLAVFVRRRMWKAAGASVGVFVAVNAAGLLLPGITIESSIASLAGSEWLYAVHNGSVAAFLDHNVVLGGVVVGVVWLFGMVRSPDVRTDLSVTFPAMVLASPLAWVGYLTVLTVPAAVNRLWLVAGIQLVGYLWLPQKWVVLLTAGWVLVTSIRIRSGSLPTRRQTVDTAQPVATRQE